MFMSSQIHLVFMQFVLLAVWVPLLGAGIGAEHDERLNQVRERLNKQGFELEILDALFSDERIALYPEIVSLTGKGFNYLGPGFGLLKKRSVERGRNIIKERRQLLDGIERSLEVQKEIIIAIMRIETNFGRSTGNRPVLNSLLTLALVENRRSSWAEVEIGHFLRICSQRDIDPFDIKGSWAGAFGLAQFIPSSYANYGIDGNGDGVIDLFNFDDAAWSIANYLKVHGWQKNTQAGNRKAVWSYNHCESYVDAVFAYASALKRPVRGAPGSGKQRER
jgi:membrane-bound lytic murein transglycosylase B